MAARSLEVVARAKDGSSAALKKVQRSLRDTGKAAKRTGVDFTEFNRVMFSTTAFIGIFSNAIRQISDTLMEGAKVDRVASQFERVLGPSGRFFNAISGLTDNTIDRMEAMRAGISLKSLGIADNMDQIAGIVSRAGTAAKLAGKDSSEGIKQYTNFLKTGSIASLSFLNIIAETNPALQAQMAILQKAGGPLGKVITTQQKLAIGAALLQAATEGQLKGQRDLLDVLKDMGQAFFFAKANVGKFIGTALTPLLEKVTKAVFSFSDLIERIRTGDKQFMMFTKNLIVAGSAIISVLASLGTARLLFKALAAIGIGGIPFLALSVVSLAAAFSDLDKGLERVTRVFKLMGASVLGVFQLMSSFINSTENAASGIGKMDSALYDLLDEAGLLGFVTNISRAGIAVVEFGKGVVSGITQAFDYLNDKFGGAIDKIKEWLGLDTGPWSRNVLKNAKAIGEVVGKLGATVLGVWGAFKLLGGAKALLSKIPIIGKFFGGGGPGGRGPSGTSADPIFVSMAGNFLSSNRVLGSTAMGEIFTNPGGKMSGLMEVVKTAVGTAVGFLFSPFRSLAGVAGRVAGALGGLNIAALASRAGLLGLAVAAGYGIGKGLIELDEEFFGGAVGNAVSKGLDSIAGLFGATGSTADQERIAALQSSPAYSSILQAAGGAGVSVSAGESLKMAQSLQSSLAQGSPLGAELSRFQTSMFAKKLATPSELGIGNGNTITSEPTMPTNEFFKKRQIQETMKMVNEDTANRMQAAFSKALRDNQITRTEWEEIYAAGMNKSKVGSREPGPQRPDHSAARSRRGC